MGLHTKVLSNKRPLHDQNNYEGILVAIIFRKRFYYIMKCFQNDIHKCRALTSYFVTFIKYQPSLYMRAIKDTLVHVLVDHL